MKPLRLLLLVALTAGCATPSYAEPAERPPQPSEPAPLVNTPMPPWPAAPRSGPPPRPELACSTHQDCVLSCEGLCCGAPCGCRRALNRAAHEEELRTRAERCADTRPQDCPAMACAYQPAFGAACQEGQCVALMSLAAPPPPRPRPAPASGASNLPGVRLEFPPQPVHFTRAQLAAGVTLRWELVVEPEAHGRVTPDPVPNGCGRPGNTGLVTHAVIRGEQGAQYCLCDVGLCPAQGETVALVPGRDAGSLFWDGSTWSGPSDTNRPKGPPFPPGPAELEVVSRGTIDGRPFRVEGRLKLLVLR